MQFCLFKLIVCLSFEPCILFIKANHMLACSLVSNCNHVLSVSHFIVCVMMMILWGTFHFLRYRAVVEKSLSVDEVQVLFTDFGNVSSLNYPYMWPHIQKPSTSHTEWKLCCCFLIIRQIWVESKTCENLETLTSSKMEWQIALTLDGFDFNLFADLDNPTLIDFTTQLLLQRRQFVRLLLFFTSVTSQHSLMMPTGDLKSSHRP